MLALARRRPAWLAALILWAAVLFYLSSRSVAGPEIDLQHIDKIYHFGYFLGGGFLLAGWLALANPQNPRWKPIIFTSIIGLSLFGILDEWHQLFTPGRSGGDFGDWLADTLGGAAGTFILTKTYHLIRSKTA